MVEPSPSGSVSDIGGDDGPGGADGSAAGSAGGGNGEEEEIAPGDCDALAFANPGASELQYDFDSPVPGEFLTTDCFSVEHGGGEASPTNDYCLLATTVARHLTCDTYSFRVESTGSQALGMQRVIYIDETGPNPQRYNIIQEADAFRMGGKNVASYNPESDLWWRVRGTSDRLFLETSPDAVIWESRHSIEAPFSLDSVLLTIGAGVYKPEDVPTPGTARIECLNMTNNCTY